MRGLVMSARSVYHGCYCPHCGRRISNGRAFFGSTYYFGKAAGPEIKWVRTQSSSWCKEKGDEFIVRVAYHKVCVEKVLQRSPDDPKVSNSKLEEYRVQLLERYGLTDEDATTLVEELA